MNRLPKAFQIIIGLAIVAVVGLVIHQQRKSSDDAGWTALAVAAGKGGDIEALREAALDAKDTSAEPWVAVQLSTALYDAGGAANVDQARVVARQALERFPGHPAASLLSSLLAALDSLAAPG
jgi:predicted Zn-dependent protease